MPVDTPIQFSEPRQKDLDRVEDRNRIARREITPMEYQLQYAAVSMEFARNAKFINEREIIQRIQRKCAEALRQKRESRKEKI